LRHSPTYEVPRTARALILRRRPKATDPSLAGSC